MEFIVATQNDLKKARSSTRVIRSNGIQVFDVRKVEILADSDNSVVDYWLLLYCKSSWILYMLFKMKYHLDKQMYNGLKLLF
jgi:hypothetical protein